MNVIRPSVNPAMAMILSLGAFPLASAEQQHRAMAQAVTELARPRKAYNGPRVPRNAACPCQSGKKYKRCCIA